MNKKDLLEFIGIGILGFGIIKFIQAIKIQKMHKNLKNELISDSTYVDLYFNSMETFWKCVELKNQINKKEV